MYYFRADGNAVTGVGHLMRCLTIADELNKLPEGIGQVTFLCADEASGKLAADRGYKTIVLQTDYRNMEEELPKLSQLFKGSEPVILVDSYHVTESYLKRLTEYGRVFLLDDMGQKAWPVDGIINYNAFARDEWYEQLYREPMESQNSMESQNTMQSQSRGSAMQTARYIGSAYVPIRPRFLNVPYTVRNQVQEVLITTGGGDSENIAAEILKAIRNPKWNYQVVVGRFNKHFEKWKQWEQEFPQIQVHHDVQDMASLMKQCDLAITAGGTTIYELAAIGVPFLCFSYAENQEALTEYIGREHIAGYCGAYHHDRQQTLAVMKELAQKASDSHELRMQMYEAEKKMIDGHGAERIARVLTERKSLHEDTH